MVQASRTNERCGVARRQTRVFLRHGGSERDRSRTSLRTPKARVIFFARPENGLLAFALTPPL